MSVETPSKEPTPEQEEPIFQTLEEFLEFLEKEGIKTLSAEKIKDQFKQVGNAGAAIVTREFNSGIRISREGSRTRGYTYKIWTTNALEDPEHPLVKKIRHKEITID